MKLFLMSFSYIGNVVSAQLIHKETPPKLQAHSSMPISTVCPYHWIKGTSIIQSLNAVSYYKVGQDDFTPSNDA